MIEWTEERKLAAMLHALGSRLWKARLALTYLRPSDQLWAQRYVADVGELLTRLGHAEWANAPEDTCCQSACSNPRVHPHRSADCVYD